MNKHFGIALTLSLGLLSASAAMADDTVAGAVVGGSVGALVGHSMGGRDGAIIGGAIGALTGVAIADDDHRHRRHSRVYLAPPPVYAPPPPVYYAPPPPVYYAPRPVVYVPYHHPRPYVHHYYGRHGRHDRDDD